MKLSYSVSEEKLLICGVSVNSNIGHIPAFEGLSRQDLSEREILITMQLTSLLELQYLRSVENNALSFLVSYQHSSSEQIQEYKDRRIRP